MRDQQPANNLLSIASAEWIQALQNFSKAVFVLHAGPPVVWVGLFGDANLTTGCVRLPFSSDRHAFSATGPAISFFISSSAASCRPTPARSPRMNASQHLVTHECMNCGQHHPLHLVRQILPAENTPEGEAEVLVCPCCGSYDVHQLEAVRDEH
ncbi:hypothetical protein ACOAP6_20315 [Pseudomonas aeruginosa]